MNEEDNSLYYLSWIHRLIDSLIKSYKQQQKGYKHKTKGEEISDHPV